MEAFAPEIEWDELDGGARIVLWLPYEDVRKFRRKGIHIWKQSPSSGYFVELITRASKKHHRAGHISVNWRSPGSSKTAPLFCRECTERLVVLAAIQEAYKIATSKAYKLEYLARERVT